MTAISQLSNKIKKLNEEIKQYAEDAFRETFAEIFQKNLELKSIFWKQYTPYFNDGDTCIFNRHEIGIILKSPYLERAWAGVSLDSDTECPEVNESELEDFRDECQSDGGDLQLIYTKPNVEKIPSSWNKDYIPDRLDRGGEPGPIETRLSDVISGLNQIEKDLYLYAFGDHVKVKVTRSRNGKVKIETEECSHD